MDETYEATIGLEVHAELKTTTKMFCASLNDPDETRPNFNVCPVCLAHPGTLPVINHEAVRHVLRVGLALGARLADYTEFDRKNYFYPDLPKGYQISQFEYPLVSGGDLNGVPITRVHLEEDTASSIHDDETGMTMIDFNRSGVPLMELVTEPAMHSAEEAGAFARELQLLLRYLGVSDANMEKGQMRVEANVSVARKGERSKAYVEIKNLNSFRTMERAVAYEIERQRKMIESGEELKKQTLGWDEKKQATFPQRSKEGSADYRYFPDPDLPSLRISELKEFGLVELQSSIPELPTQRRERYVRMGIKHEDAELYIGTPMIGDYFDRVCAQISDKKAIQLASNYLANDVMKIIRDREVGDEIESIPIRTDSFVGIIRLLIEDKITSRSAKDLLVICGDDERSPEVIASEKKLLQENSRDALASTVESVIAEHPSVIADYKAGKTSVLEFLVGQSMKALRGSGNPAALRALFIEKIQ